MNRHSYGLQSIFSSIFQSDLRFKRYVYWPISRHVKVKVFWRNRLDCMIVYSVYTTGYICVPTRSTFGEVDPFCLISQEYSFILLTNNPFIPLLYPYMCLLCSAILYQRCLNDLVPKMVKFPKVPNTAKLDAIIRYGMAAHGWPWM